MCVIKMREKGKDMQKQCQVEASPHSHHERKTYLGDRLIRKSIFIHSQSTFFFPYKPFNMKLILAAALLSNVASFAPNAQNQRLPVSLSSAVAPPERTAPSAGWMPDWEDRPGLSPEEFMESDMSKADRSEMWECPLTRWDSDGYVLLFFLLIIRIMNFIEIVSIKIMFGPSVFC